jgi:hypothetical protein
MNSLDALLDADISKVAGPGRNIVVVARSSDTKQNGITVLGNISIGSISLDITEDLWGY